MTPTSNSPNLWPYAQHTANDQNRRVQIPFREGESKGAASSEETIPRLPHRLDPGTQPDHVYDASMAWWRAGIRRFLGRNLRAESRWLAEMQKRIRTPWLDTYFVYTSTLGTHTFFMTLLPAVFFFGYPETGRGIVHVLAFGVYFSSLVKDLICSPRPFAPPVTRLTMGSHHLEYGFPSTHSTNSVSMALYIYSIVHGLRPGPDDVSPSALSPVVFYASSILLILYTFSIVFGRLYCAMHSFTDCFVGVVLGSAIAAAQWALGDLFEKWLAMPGWTVPLVVIPLGLILVNQHAEPVDDCPCFEDAIAFIAVVMGCGLGKWHGYNWGLDMDTGFFRSRTPGWEGRNMADWSLWLTFAAAKMVVGVAIIFGWRLLAKYVLHATLPPLFRKLARLFTLPNRRFYTPATDYDGSVPEGDGGLRSIPSVIDIPGMMHSSDGGASTALPQYALGHPRGDGASVRGGKPNGSFVGEKIGNVVSTVMVVEEEDDSVKKHYDADVLTKVIVYAGIGWLASEFIPVIFELLGWGVLPAARQPFVEI